MSQNREDKEPARRQAELEVIEQALNTLDLSQKLIDLTLKRIELPEHKNWRLNTGNIPGVPPELYDSNDVNQGMIYDLKPMTPPSQNKKPADVPYRHSTPDEDKNAKVVILLGIDFTGAAYGHNYFQQLEPLLTDTGLATEEIITHHHTLRVT